MNMKSIRERCHVNTNAAGDRFVGVRVNTDDVVVCFPIGYQLPDNDTDIRRDINNLFGILSTFMKEDGVIENSKFSPVHTVEFPMHAYLKIIRHYLRTGQYYTECSPRFKTETRGYVSWAKTVIRQSPLIQKNGSLVFTKMTVRTVTPNDNKLITQIHRYCVYEAFERLGWLYVPYVPERPGFHPSLKESICILTKKLVSTYNDQEQELFSAMIDILIYVDKKNNGKQHSFGTENFERVWEKMIDKAFGVDNKESYFPNSRWYLDFSREKENRTLFPDSIMIYNDKIYILDAKYYRYGCTGISNHLPNGSDINKQITYGEYIALSKEVPNDMLYNAFIIPFNKQDNPFIENASFIGLSSDIANVGEAVGGWKENNKYYERVQGIVMDTRFLMYNYAHMPEQRKQDLAENIEKVRLRELIPKTAN